MKVLVTSIGLTKSGKLARVVFVQRLPKSVKALDEGGLKVLVEDRKSRVKAINKYRREHNKPEIMVVYNKDVEFSEMDGGYKVVSWSPIINVDKLEILQKYL